MEDNSTRQTEVSFYLGIVFLIISMLLTGITLYMLPHLLFSWVYDVPEFVSEWREGIVNIYDYTQFTASMIILSVLLILSIIAVILTVIFSSQLTPEVPENTTPENHARRTRIRRDLQSTSYYLIRLIVIVLAVIAVVEIIEFFLFIEPKAVL